MIVSFDVFCYNINTWWDALGTNSCLCPLAMVKLVLLYLISLKVAVSQNLSMMLSEDLEYIGFYWVLHKLELLKIIWISLGLPWMVWLSGLGIVLQTERSPVGFPVSHRAHAYAVGPVPSWVCVRGNWSMFLSLFPLSLPFSLKINKQNL